MNLTDKIYLSGNQRASVAVGLALVILRKRRDREKDRDGLPTRATLYSRHDDSLAAVMTSWEVDNLLSEICVGAEISSKQLGLAQSNPLLSGPIFYFDLCAFTWISPAPVSTSINTKDSTKFLNPLLSALNKDLEEYEINAFKSHVR